MVTPDAGQTVAHSLDKDDSEALLGTWHCKHGGGAVGCLQSLVRHPTVKNHMLLKNAFCLGKLLKTRTIIAIANHMQCNWYPTHQQIAGGFQQGFESLNGAAFGVDAFVYF